MDKKFSVHFGEDKTKSSTLAIHHGDIEIKQYSKITYLGCIKDENLSGQKMATKVNR